EDRPFVGRTGGEVLVDAHRRRALVALVPPTELPAALGTGPASHDRHGTVLAVPFADLSARVVLFDLDGCLVDSTLPIRRCLDAALADHGLPPLTDDRFRRHVGPPLQVSLAERAAELGRPPELVAALIDSYRSRYASMSVELAVSYPGVAELVADLSAAGVRLGVVTSKPYRFARPILDALDLT